MPSSSAPPRHHVGPPCLGVPSQSSRAELHQRRESSRELLTAACRLPPHLYLSHGSPSTRPGVVSRLSFPPGLRIARRVRLYLTPCNAMPAKDGLGSPMPASPGQHTEQGRASVPSFLPRVLDSIATVRDITFGPRLAAERPCRPADTSSRGKKSPWKRKAPRSASKTKRRAI